MGKAIDEKHLDIQEIEKLKINLALANTEIKNMSSYLISTLYIESLVGTLDIQARLHDDYTKFLRGKPYLNYGKEKVGYGGI